MRTYHFVLSDESGRRTLAEGDAEGGRESLAAHRFLDDVFQHTPVKRLRVGHGFILSFVRTEDPVKPVKLPKGARPRAYFDFDTGMHFPKKTDDKPTNITELAEFFPDR